MAPPSASETLLRHWRYRQTGLQVAAAHSLYVLPLFPERPNKSAQSHAVNQGVPEANQRGRIPGAQALCRVSGRALGSFTTFLPRPPWAGQRAPGSWSCAHTRLCLLRVASGRREGTINTALLGSETERLDPQAAAQPLLPLGCVTRETLSLSGCRVVLIL